MTQPEAAAFLAKARQSLTEARIVADNSLSEAAGRAAYLVAYHAAQALIFARTGKASKSHNGVRSEFARLARVNPTSICPRSVLAHLPGARLYVERRGVQTPICAASY